MKYKWLQRENNPDIIIFFNGWGMDESVIKHLKSSCFDVVMFFDYNSLETDFDFEILKSYKKRYLIAWSMGVMTATLFKNKLSPIDFATAVNGTLKPIDNNFGIPQKIYELTIRCFNPSGAEKFVNNMFLNSEKTTLRSKRDFENIKTELSALKEYKSDESFKYDRVIISDEDKIIPSKNQAKYWNTEPNIHAGHCPFQHFGNWSELL